MYEFMHFLSLCRNDFKDFSLQSRLHFRIHAAQTEIRKQREANCKDGATKEKGRKNNKKHKSKEKDKLTENGRLNNGDSLTDDDDDFEELDEENSFHEAEDGILPLSNNSSSSPSTSTSSSAKSGHVDHGRLVKESMTEEEALKIIQGR